MSRIPKWKLDKTKVKVVFRLQFHATHIPQRGWDKLSVSFIPADTAKATAKTNKANVRNGICKWSDPIYETTRLFLDTRTKNYDEKLYKLVVAMGTTRSSLLGEVIINLADYADAAKPSSVALPLDGCEFGTILHVTVQLLTSKTGFREFEQQSETRERGSHTISGQSTHEPAEKVRDALGAVADYRDKVNSRVRFKSNSIERPSLEEMGGSNEDTEDPAAGLDGSSYTSESIYAEKNDSNTLEVESIKSTISGDASGVPLSPSPHLEKRELFDHHLLVQGSNDWAHGWSSDYSIDNDIASAYEENSRLRRSLEVAESSISELKMEVSSIQSIADELGAETQKLAQQLSTEFASGEVLAQEMSVLKSECLKFKSDFEELKHDREMLHFTCWRTDLPKSEVMEMIKKTEETREDQITSTLPRSSLQVSPTVRNHDLSAAFFNEDKVGAQSQDYLLIEGIEDLSLIEAKVKQIQDKVRGRCDGEYLDFLLSDLETLEYDLQDFKQGITPYMRKVRLVKGTEVNETQATRMHHQSGPFILEQGQEGDSNIVMKNTICELLSELEKSKIEQENLAKRMNEMECYYETLILELEESHKHTLNELENLRTDHSSCLFTISTLENQIEKMHHDVSEQFLQFSEDRHALDSLNKDLEKRAIASEMALKGVRWNYSIAVDRLQKDLELLSVQVLSMFETNVNLAREASHLYFHDYPQVHSEVVQSCLHKDDGQYKPSAVEIQPEIVLWETEDRLSSMFKTAPLKLDYKMSRNFDLSVENKGFSFTRGPTHADLGVLKDEENAHVNGINAEKLGPVVPMSKVPQVKDNLINCADTFAETPRSDEHPGCSAILSSKTDSQKSETVGPALSLNQIVEPEKQVLNEYTTDKIKRSLHLQEELHLKAEAEYSEMHLLNICLEMEVYSQVLQEMLHEKSYDIIVTNKKMYELTMQLKSSIESKELLMLELQTALDDARILIEDKDNHVAKCNNLTLKNHVLEAKLQDVAAENSFLFARVAECQRLILECEIYKSKFEACNAEKMDLQELLKQESLQMSCLQRELTSMSEDYKALKAEYGAQIFINDDLEKAINSLREKLGSICCSIDTYYKQIDGPPLASLSLERELENNDYMAIFMHLEQLQKFACHKILQLTHEKKEIEEQRDILQGLVNGAESQVLSLKQNFDSNLQELMTKLDFSNALVENLQLQLKDVTENLKITSEVKEKQVEKNRELSSKISVLEFELQQATSVNRDLSQNLLLLEGVKEELERTKVSLTTCMHERETMTLSIQSRNEASIQLENELNSLKEMVTCTHDELQAERDFRQKLEATITSLTLQFNDKDEQLLSFNEQRDELVDLRLQISNLELEKSRLQHILVQGEEHQTRLDGENSLLCSQVEDLEYELRSSNENLRCTHAELNIERSSREELEVNVADLAWQLNKKHEQMLSFDEQKHELDHLRQQLSDLESEKSGLQHILVQSKEHTSQLDSEVSILRSQLSELENEHGSLRVRLECTNDELHYERGFREKLEAEVTELTSQLNEKHEKLLSLDEQKTELVHLRSKLDSEVSFLRSQLGGLENEHGSLRESLECTNSELHYERGFREKLEAEVIELTSQLNENHEKLLSLDEQKTELVHLRKRTSDLESEKSELQHLLLVSKECQKGLENENSFLHIQVADLEIHLGAMHEHLLTVEIKLIFIRNQYQTRMQELVHQLKMLERYSEDLHLTHLDAVTTVQNYMISEAKYLEENKKLSVTLQSLQSEFEIVVGEKKELANFVDKISGTWAVYKNFITGDDFLGVDSSQQKYRYGDENEPFERLLWNFKEEVDKLTFSRIELETTIIVLRSKLREQKAQIALNEECGVQLMKLREQHNELTYRLSEQVLKTEEFKNLSIRLKELKDKADAEYLQAHEKRENPSVNMQESLRIAFIKEQCETKLQELNTQIYVSKKHGEEMLIKLQNALDEVDSLKKAEVIHVKRNEELSMKILELEAELQTVVTDRRELVKAYDRIKTELECSFISLDCCKEEKLKLETSLRECGEERKKNRVELDLMKRRLESLASSGDIQELRNNEFGISNTMPFGQLLEENNFGMSVNYQQASNPVQKDTNTALVTRALKMDGSGFLDKGCALNSLDNDALLVPINDSAHSNTHLRSRSSLDGLVSKSAIEIARVRFREQENASHDNSKHVAGITDQINGQQSLKTSVELIQKELEKLKNENLASLLPIDEHQLDPSLQDLQRELWQLDMANEHLGNIYPVFKEFSGSGNALERVLALELELAEALQAKKKPEIHFQSSFLRHHNDEEAVFQSFRDINDLIKDMLELKGRYTAVETELKEMQGRYSQLSLQFAEVEGERQKLVMTLKNRRVPKKP